MHIKVHMIKKHGCGKRSDNRKTDNHKQVYSISSTFKADKKNRCKNNSVNAKQVSSNGIAGFLSH
jgi:hypothetical protein